MTKSLDKLCNEAMDISESFREKIMELQDAAENVEGAEEVSSSIINGIPKFVEMNNSLEDILSAIEDMTKDIA